MTLLWCFYHIDKYRKYSITFFGRFLRGYYILYRPLYRDETFSSQKDLDDDIVIVPFVGQQVNYSLLLL